MHADVKFSRPGLTDEEKRDALCRALAALFVEELREEAADITAQNAPADACTATDLYEGLCNCGDFPWTDLIQQHTEALLQLEAERAGKGPPAGVADSAVPADPPVCPLDLSDPRVATREDFRRLAQVRYPGREEELAEYVAEAEHWDGLDYWDEYGPVMQLANDFGIYLKTLEGE